MNPLLNSLSRVVIRDGKIEICDPNGRRPSSREMLATQIGAESVPHLAPISTLQWVQRAWLKAMDFLNHARFNRERKNTNSQPMQPLGDFNFTKSALLARTSVRAFKKLPVNRQELESCISAAFKGIASPDPDFGLFLICAIYDVEGMAPGIYRVSTANSFALIEGGVFREAVSEKIAGMATALTANFTLFICADFSRYLSLANNDNLSLRKLYYFCGMIFQRILAQGASQRIQGVPTPALSDTKLAELLGIHKSGQLPIYSLTMGKVDGH